MSQGARGVELECKLHLPDPAAVLERLRAAGATDRGVRFEANWTFDTPEKTLRAKPMLVRLRRYDDNPWGVLTIKLPGGDSVFKRRVEHETRVEDPAVVQALLETLGYGVDWYYEKRRHFWELEGCEICLDEMPLLGTYLEIEAESEATIQRLLRVLGLDPKDHIDDNYRGIFYRYCQERGLEPTHWTF